MVPALVKDASSVVFTLPSSADRRSIQFRDPEITEARPILDLKEPMPHASQVATEANNPAVEPGQWQVGNGSFNHMAQSFNLGKTDEVAKDDLSRQLGKAGGSPNVATATPITGSALVGVAVLVVLIAMSVAYYENDKDDRKRRKKVRRRKHRHSS